MGHQHALQALPIDASIFKGFIQTGPCSLKERRERQLGKAVGRRFGGQGINGIEQGIGAAAETAVDLVTKFIQCVKVQLSNAPSLFLRTLLVWARLCKGLAL
jgi:hypothetical protein